VKSIAIAVSQPVAVRLDQRHRVFADKQYLFEPGTTYEIEYTENASNGVTYRNVKPATAVAPAAIQRPNAWPHTERSVMSALGPPGS
jgi:hypothetical protein